MCFPTHMVPLLSLFEAVLYKEIGKIRLESLMWSPYAQMVEPANAPTVQMFLRAYCGGAIWKW